MLEVGKLYQIKKHFWYLYCSKENALVGADRNFIYDFAAIDVAGAFYIPESSIFCLLEQDGNYLKILPTNGELGWMIYPENESYTEDCIEELKE